MNYHQPLIVPNDSSCLQYITCPASRQSNDVTSHVQTDTVSDRNEKRKLQIVQQFIDDPSDPVGKVSSNYSTVANYIYLYLYLFIDRLVMIII